MHARRLQVTCTMRGYLVLALFCVQCSLSRGASFVARQSGRAPNEEDAWCGELQVGVAVSSLLNGGKTRQLDVWWDGAEPRDGDWLGLFAADPAASGGSLPPPVYAVRAEGRRSGWVTTSVRQPNLQTSLGLDMTAATCLGAWVAYLSADNSSVLASSCLRTLPTWMADMNHTISSLRLQDTFLPGTHDSGSYNETNGKETIVAKYTITQVPGRAGELLPLHEHQVVGEPRPLQNTPAAAAHRPGQEVRPKHQGDRHSRRARVPCRFRVEPVSARAPAAVLERAARSAGHAQDVDLAVDAGRGVELGQEGHRVLQPEAAGGRQRLAVDRGGAAVGRRRLPRQAARVPRHRHDETAQEQRMGGHGRADSQRSAGDLRHAGRPAQDGGQREPQRDGVVQGLVGQDRQHRGRGLLPWHRHRGRSHTVEPAAGSPGWLPHVGRQQRLVTARALFALASDLM